MGSAYGLALSSSVWPMASPILGGGAFCIHQCILWTDCINSRLVYRPTVIIENLEEIVRIGLLTNTNHCSSFTVGHT